MKRDNRTMGPVAGAGAWQRSGRASESHAAMIVSHVRRV